MVEILDELVPYKSTVSTTTPIEVVVVGCDVCEAASRVIDAILTTFGSGTVGVYAKGAVIEGYYNGVKVVSSSTMDVTRSIAVDRVGDDKLKDLTRMYNLAKVRRDKVRMSDLEKQLRSFGAWSK